jgi:tetratricopeptide (TPR) repeat protein
MMKPERQLLPICAMLLLSSGCVTRTTILRAPQAPPAHRPIAPASLTEYIRGIYKLSAEASVRSQQRAALLVEAPDLADWLDRAEQDPDDLEARSRVVAGYMSRRLYWGAYELLTASRSAEISNDPDTNLNLAIIWDAWGVYDLAAQYADRAIAQGATSAGAYQVMGRIQLHRNDPTQALIWYSRSLEQERTPVVLANLGYAYMRKGEWDSARAALDEATALDDSLKEAHNNLALILSREGDETGALKHLLRAGSPAAAYNNMGVLHLRESRVVYARQYFEEALRLDPNHDLASRNLAALTPQNEAPLIVRLRSHPDDVHSPVETGTTAQSEDALARFSTPVAEEPVKAAVLQAPTTIQAEPSGAIEVGTPASQGNVPSPALATVRQAPSVESGGANRGWGLAGFAGLAFVTGLFAMKRRIG